MTPNAVADGGIEIHAAYDEPHAVTTQLVRAVAAIDGVSPSELDSLYDSVDPESVSKLLSHAGEHDCRLSIEFTYEGYTIAVSDSGRIHVRDGALPTERSGESSRE
ncbi:HalOD1 output domain-containing protein [Natronosalvus vescus]|uniref:HalOD1 output domain-containing protein n=1 Tax=Natronosalvus vescus TaxID=2953881 RepID=UPI0020901B52|nr:HalOD1 output domain-containing protein [Natronosalvus vescus]